MHSSEYMKIKKSPTKKNLSSLMLREMPNSCYIPGVLFDLNHQCSISWGSLKEEDWQNEYTPKGHLSGCPAWLNLGNPVSLEDPISTHPMRLGTSGVPPQVLKSWKFLESSGLQSTLEAQEAQFCFQGRYAAAETKQMNFPERAKASRHKAKLLSQISCQQIV